MDKKSPVLTGAAAEREMRRMTRRGFMVGGLAALAGLGAWAGLTNAARDDGIPWPLRRILRFNERIAEGLGAPRGLAPTFAAGRVHDPPRTNGLVGLSRPVDA